MNSEIITGIEYRPADRRKSRRKRRRSHSGGFFRWLLLFAVVLSAAGIWYRGFGDLLRDRYDLRGRTECLLRETAPSSALSPFAASLAVVSEEDESSEGETIGANSGLLIEEGQEHPIFSKHAFQKMNPASTTKIMTCLVALEHVDLSEVWTAGPEVRVSEPNASMAGIKEGDQLTAEQVLYGLMLESGADAANMVALHVAGGEERFVALMNEKAKQIGAVHTHYTNTHGLTAEGHYTDAYDLYLILHEAMKNRQFPAFAGTDRYRVEYLNQSGEKQSREWESTNYYLNGKAQLPPGLQVLAGKTGTTMAAGACLAQASRTEDGSVVYSILLKAANHDSLYREMNVLLEKVAHLD